MTSKSLLLRVRRGDEKEVKAAPLELKFEDEVGQTNGAGTCSGPLAEFR